MLFTVAMMSINSLEVESGVPALFIRKSYLTDNFCLNFISRNNVKGNGELENFVLITNY